jgi:bacterioferritin
MDRTSELVEQGEEILRKEELHRHAARNSEEGAVVSAYGMGASGGRLDRLEVVSMLNEALATEVVCALRYRQHSFVAKGISSPSVAKEFLEHSNDEWEHADCLARRIVQLNGKPDLDPSEISQKSLSDYSSGSSLEEMIRENLISERVAISSYRDAILNIGDRDPTTRRLLEGIRAKEEEHADDMATLLGGV